MIGKRRGPAPAMCDGDVSQVAQRLFAAGDTREAVRVFAQAGRYREAAHILKHTGHVEAAARFYIKGKAFDLAEGCYLTLGDRLNAARCAAAAGNHARAATTFEELGDRRAAAEAHAKAGDWLHAGRLYHGEGLFGQATAAFGEWLRRAGERHRDQVALDDVDRMVDALAQSTMAKDLLRFVLAKGRVTSLVTNLLEQGRLAIAVEVFEHQKVRLDDSFFDWVRIGREYAERGLLFATKVADPQLQAQLLELLGRSTEAAQAYLTAGDYTNAYSCSLKAEDWQQIERMKAIIAARGETMPGLHLREARGQNERSSSVMSRPRSFALDGDSVVAGTLAEGTVAGEPTAQMQVDESFVAADVMLTPLFMDSKLFRGLALEERQTLWSLGHVTSVPKDGVIVEAGIIPIGTYTLLEGAVEVQRQADDGYRVVDRIVPGQNFGETWLLVGRASGVRIVASANCRVHVVERQKLDHVEIRASGGAARLMKSLAVSLLGHLFTSYGSAGILVAAEGNL